TQPVATPALVPCVGAAPRQDPPPFPTRRSSDLDSLQVAISNLGAVATGGPRQVLVALVRPNGYGANAASFRIYSIHLKAGSGARSEEHTSELQSLRHLVCRLLLEKKNDANQPSA